VTNNQTCNWGRYYNLQRIGIAYHNEFAPNQYFEIIPYFSNQFVDHPIFQTLRQENNNVGGEFRYVNSNSLFGKNNSFVMGFQPRYGVPTARAVREHQRQHRGHDAELHGEDDLLRHAYAEDAFDATKDFTIVIGGRWDYTGRQATVDNFGPAGNPFNPNTPSVPTGTNRGRCNISMRSARSSASSTARRRPRRCTSTPAGPMKRRSISNCCPRQRQRHAEHGLSQSRCATRLAVGVGASGHVGG
jgi:hypothetical protein